MILKVADRMGNEFAVDDTLPWVAECTKARELRVIEEDHTDVAPQHVIRATEAVVTAGTVETAIDFSKPGNWTHAAEVYRGGLRIVTT